MRAAPPPQPHSVTLAVRERQEKLDAEKKAKEEKSMAEKKAKEEKAAQDVL